MASRDAVSTPGRDTRRLPDRASENANSGVLRAELFQFLTHVYLLMASGVSRITTATKMEDPKIVLVDILTTLHRLEARFDDQSDRISVIERCVSPEPDQNPTLRRSASSRTWASERVSAERMAAEYKSSVGNIRNRFEFIDDWRSELSAHTANATHDDNRQSISVHSLSPPQSRSQLQIELIPPPRNPNREKAPETRKMITTRYEDMSPNPTVISSSSSFSKANSFSNSQFSSRRGGGASTRASTPGYAGTVTFSDILDPRQINNDEDRDSFSGPQLPVHVHVHIKQFVSRYLACLRGCSRVWAARTFDGLCAVAEQVPDEVESLRRTAGRASKSCGMALRRAAACAGRKMVDLQLKRLGGSV